ncbi:response regulator transcription factor [Sphingobacterium anhuiense]|uniref:Response regulator transcription factor n=1 Tax=Sphingobacterium anhuiense TaxID=493780 RepID=A0ABW5Z2T0_9SPHI
MNKLLLIEDDADFGFMLQHYLQLSGYDVHWMQSPAELLLAENILPYDLLILDVMLPVKSGFTLAQEIKEYYPEVPFIFLTAKEQKIDKITGLKIGADDYLTKPCDPEELVLRIQNILKRNKKNDQITSITLGSYQFFPQRLLLTHPLEQFKLTEREAKLLQFLCQRNGSLVTREEILQQVWGNSDFFNGRSMDVFITRLRKYLKHDLNLHITSSRGVGFNISF